MNSIYHTELLAPSTVPFPVRGKYRIDMLKVSLTLEYFPMEDDLKYRKFSKI